VTVDPAHLAAYNRVCGFGMRDELPATFPHVLAFPLHMKLLTHRDFPFRAVGLVHFANRITQHRPILSSERLSFRVRLHGLENHPKGRKFDIATQGTVDEELVWRDTSTILRVGGGEEGPDDREDEPDELPTSAEWRVERSTGARYAIVSRDRNPIHVNRLAAKLFGFPSVIAPGMWTKARCLAALEGHLPEAFTVEAEFRRPLVLPAKVAFGSWLEGDRRRIAVHDSGSDKIHLLGSLDPTRTGPAGDSASRAAPSAGGRPG
jgi:acyl dehydratase